MKKRMLLFFLTAYIGTHVYAQGQAILDINAVLSAAYQRNPKVIKARKNIEKAKQNQRQVKKLDNPEIEIDVEKIVNDLESQAEYDKRNLEGELRITQPIKFWGKRGLERNIATIEIKQAQHEFQKVWTKVTRQIKDQYSEALLHQKRIDLAKGNLEISQRLLEQVNIKFNTGKARNHELVRAKLETSRAKNEFLKSEKDFFISLGKLNFLMGQGINENIRLTDNLSSESLSGTLEELKKEALKNRPDYLKQKLEVDKKDEQIKLSKRKNFSDMNLGIFAEREEEELSAGLGLSFELPLWNQHQEDIRQAMIDKEIAQIELNAASNKVMLDVYSTFKNADLAKRFVENLEKSIEESNELMRIISIQYEEGEATFLEYLEAITSYKRSKYEYIESLADYSQKIAALNQAVGKSEAIVGGET